MNPNNQIARTYPLYSSTLTFSSKNTEEHSTCNQSLLVEGTSPPRHTSPLLHTPQLTPQPPVLPSTRPLRSSTNSRVVEIQEAECDHRGLFFKYKEIERILKGENDNLKNQNNLLLFEISKLRQANNKYRKMDRMQKLQLEQVREECQAQRNRAEELKEIVVTRLAALEERLDRSSSADKSSFLAEMLEFSQELRE